MLLIVNVRVNFQSYFFLKNHNEKNLDKRRQGFNIRSMANEVVTVITITLKPINYVTLVLYYNI